MPINDKFLTSSPHSNGFDIDECIRSSLYDAWPSDYERLDRTISAMRRLESRRGYVLPHRSQFQSTADLYNAALPMLTACHEGKSHPLTKTTLSPVSFAQIMRGMIKHKFF